MVVTENKIGSSMYNYTVPAEDHVSLLSLILSMNQRLAYDHIPRNALCLLPRYTLENFFFFKFRDSGRIFGNYLLGK